MRREVKRSSRAQNALGRHPLAVPEKSERLSHPAKRLTSGANSLFSKQSLSFLRQISGPNRRQCASLRGAIAAYILAEFAMIERLHCQLKRTRPRRLMLRRTKCADNVLVKHGGVFFCGAVSHRASCSQKIPEKSPGAMAAGPRRCELKIERKRAGRGLKGGGSEDGEKGGGEIC